MNQNVPYDIVEAKRLPAFAIAGEVNDRLRTGNRLIVTAPPGAGKSTLLPLTILFDLPCEGKVLMLEPRRLAAKQIAERMADLLHERVGETVGYRVRFETKVSAQTRIEVITEGILSRMLVNDPGLEGVSVVLFDEFHERSLASDVALAFTRETQQILRPDLRIVLMSATIDVDSLSSALDAPVVKAEGRLFPVEILYGEESDAAHVAEQVAHAVRVAYGKTQGDILAFLPGQAEVLRCRESLQAFLPDAEICPLYGLLSSAEQRRAVLPSPEGRRKVVLATSIAETSLTIEGVRAVVDLGWGRTMLYDQRNGLSRLATVRVTRDVAAQRAGRAGRVAPGVCYRLWTLATDHRMEENRSPEILQADFAPTMLDVAVWGESDVMRLPWLTPPPPFSVSQASRLLRLLCAVDAEGRITELGRRMADLPCHPRVSRMLLLGETNALRALAADIAAVVEERDLLSDEEHDVDINTRLVMLRTARGRGSLGRWGRVAQVAKEYRSFLHVKEDNEAPDPKEVGRLIATAYPERIACALDDCGRFRMASGDDVFLAREDALSSCAWLSIASVNVASGRIFLASPLAIEEVPHLTTRREVVSWEAKRGGVVAQEERRVGALLVSAQPLRNVDRSLLVKTICGAAVKDGLSMFDFSEEVERLQRRVQCVSSWHPELELPDLGVEAVLARAEEWLPFYLDDNGRLMTTVAEMKKIDLSSALWSLLTYEQQQEVDRLAPTHAVVPTGSKIRLDYRQGAEYPVLSVRLQECFGLTDTPRVDDGRRPVLMELLSPGFKPVQLTQDLRSFWNNAYFEVRKELRRRYPKHYWPENPLEAEATRGVKKKA